MMQSFFNNCLFCRKQLPEDANKSSREHVIPDFIGGSLVIRDVCSTCNNRFGSEVDHRILEDSRIINVINRLNLPELKQKVAEGGRTVGKDTVSGEEVEGIVVSGQPRLQSRRIEPDGISIPEEEAKA
ncbi:MAG TPA: HNH endonuclease, partial [Bacteroidetes bacterium]|nr:HNH endonuclease [Bacteroidota bacterium]